MGRFTLLLVLAATLAAFWPALSNGYALDDRDQAMATYASGRPNPMIHELQPVTEYFTSNYWRGVSEHDDLFRPLTVWTFALVHHGLGNAEGAAFAQHLVNLLLHLLAVWLSYRLLRAASASARAAALGAAVFGLHGIHSEVVATVVGRSELLAFDLGAAATLLAIRAPRSFGCLVGVAGCCFLACCSKESALVWGLVIAVLLRERPVRALTVTLVPLLAFFVLRSSAVTGETIPPAALSNPLITLDSWDRFVNAMAVWGHGARLTLVPWPLACDYSAATFPFVTLGSLAFLLSLATACILAGLAISRRPPALVRFGAGGFLLFTALTSNILFPIGTIFGERLLYTASLGLAFLAAWSIDRWSRVAPWVLIAWCLGSAWVCHGRAGVFQDNNTLFLHDVEVQPNSAMLHYNVSKIHEQRRDEQPMMKHLTRTVQLYPRHGKALMDLGVHALQMDLIPQSIDFLDRAQRAIPEGDADYFQVCINLATALAAGGQGKGAMVKLHDAQRASPARMRRRLPQVRENLAALLPADQFAKFEKLVQQ